MKNDMNTVAETEETDEESDNTEESGLAFDVDKDQGMTKIERLVEWNVEVLGSLLQQIIASRSGIVHDIDALSTAENSIGREKGTVLDEFTPIIPLRRFDTEHLLKVGEGNGLAAASSEIQRVDNDALLVDLASHGYGITSDPLTQFAVVFSAVIHDVDHPGVPNTQL
eukprot:scaffold13958_cov118-Cylindrotheca_fusiformis.AAC.1